MMNKIYGTANEKYLETVILYADKDDGHLFVDEAKKTKITKDELTNLFLKGLVTIKLNNGYFKPIEYKVSGTGCTLTAYNGTKASTFKSAEVA